LVNEINDHVVPSIKGPTWFVAHNINPLLPIRTKTYVIFPYSPFGQKKWKKFLPIFLHQKIAHRKISWVLNNRLAGVVEKWENFIEQTIKNHGGIEPSTTLVEPNVAWHCQIGRFTVKPLCHTVENSSCYFFRNSGKNGLNDT
jgi:hypothetical protein